MRALSNRLEKSTLSGLEILSRLPFDVNFLILIGTSSIYILLDNVIDDNLIRIKHGSHNVCIIPTSDEANAPSN